MPTDVDTTASRLRALAAALEPAVYPVCVPLAAAVFQTPGRIPLSEARKAAFAPVEVGWRWGPVWSTAWFRVAGEVPRALAGRPVALRFSTGTEALVWKGDEPLHGLDRNRDTVLLPDAAQAGDPIELMVEAACNHPLGVATSGLFWEPPEFHQRWSEEKPGGLERCELVLFAEPVWKLWRTIEFAAQLIEQLPEGSARAERLAAEAQRALSRFDINRPASTADAAQREIEEALRGEVAVSTTRCFAVGHAHLDTAWLWPLAETKRKALRTFATALRLMERFPGFRFLCSQAQQYAWIRDLSPRVFAQIMGRVREGRWEPMGAMWIEPDGNLPSGESFVRQILHGTRFWEQHFGARGRQRLAYLPDTFGFAASLPQIFRLAGLDTFITNKIWWNETTEFPYTHFLWRGIDGTEILSHITPGKEYNALNSPKELRLGQEIAERKGTPGIDVWLQPFGYGDGGGGPTDWIILNAELAAECEGLPNTNPDGAEAFCRELHEQRRLLQEAGRDVSVWDGELYLERHRGTYTTQAAAKRGNAFAEADLRIAEWLTFAGPVQLAAADEKAAASRLDEAWKSVLLNQFHDILPGSSIGEVYRDAAAAYAEAEAVCEDMRAAAIARLRTAADTTGMREPALVLNPGSSPRSVVLEAGDTKRCVLIRDVPAMGVRVADAAMCPDIGPAEVRSGVLSNGLIEAKIDARGRVASLRTTDGRDVVDPDAGAINQLILYDDRPRAWEAWDIDADYIDHAHLVEGASERWDESGGGARATVHVERSIGRGSRIAQTYTLLAGSPVLQVETRVDWREERMLLRALFPTVIRAETATYEIPFGHIARPTTTETPRERAMFEVPAHRWMDLSEPGLGLALLTDCKYGYSCRGSVVGLSLLRSPKWPDSQADMGQHRFVYSLMPHGGDWRAAGVDREAEMMIRPASVLPLEAGQRGTLRGEWAPFTLRAAGGASVRIAAIKRAEEGGGLIVRLVECHGRAGSCEIGWKLPVCSVRPVDLLERPMDLPGFAHDAAAGRTTIGLHRFHIVTLAVELARQQA